MPRKICLLVFLFLSVLASAQTFTIKGKTVSAVDKKPIESATVYVTSVKDSAMIDYTISDKNGNFSFSLRKQTKPFILKVSSIGFETFKKEYKSLESNLDAGEILINDDVTTLGEVLIVGEAPPVRIKNDTLEFNASSFKVRPDSNVEALLKQLPGVEISKDGKITVNGKEVNEILVNGKSFFGKDGAVAIKNLPSDIIDKIQVSDTKTTEEKLSDQSASSDKKSINITIQEDKNKGLFGKFTGGYGTDDRYESSGLLNYFKDKQKISFLGSSNNINATGFSMDEIFDAMGGGRNRSFYSRGDGSFNINGVDFGGGSGITQSTMVGLNYSDEWFKKLEPSGSYFYTNSITDNDTKSRSQNFLTSENGENSTYISESSGTSKNRNEGHNMSFDFQYKIDSLSTLSVRPTFVKNNSSFESRSESASFNDFGLVNESSSSNLRENTTANFENELYFSKKFKKKGRNFGVTFTNSNKSNDNDDITNSETYFYQDASLPGDIRRQREFDNVKENRYYTRIGYSEPVTDSISLTVRSSYQWNDFNKDQKTYNFNGGTNQYSDFNNLLSYDMSSKTRTFNPSVSLNLRKKKYSGGVGLGTQIIDFQNSSLYNGAESVVNQNYTYPTANAWLNFNLTKSQSIYMYYNFDVTMATAEQILPVIDLTNPLYQITGNPNLKPVKAHNIYLNYNNYDYATKSGFYVYGGMTFYEQQIVSARTLDLTDLINRATYQNINETYSSYAGVNWNKTIKREANTFRLGFGMSGNLSLDKGLTNNLAYEADRITIEPNVSFGWDYGELLTIEPSYTYAFNKTSYTNYTIDESSNFTHNFKLQTTSHWPKHIVFGNDFGYTYNSNISDGFKKDFFLLNTSLGYNFMDDKLLFKVKVYDVLNQNQSAVRYINPESIQDVENTVLKRYAMFSLTYKIEKFGGKKKEEGGVFNF
jgi:hypothetical protein